jgi:hypothetical protein
MHKARLLFAASIAAATADAAAGQKFSGIAYSGGLIPRWGGMVIDLSTTRVEDSMPVLLVHDDDKVAGVVKQHTIDALGLAVSGDIHTDLEPDAASVVAKAKRGNKYQMSVGIYEFVEHFISKGESEVVNGKTFQGPLVVLKNGVVREVSIVPLGADKNTSVAFFSEDPSYQPTGATPTMMTAEQIAKLQADKETAEAALKLERENNAKALRAQRDASRTAEIKARFAAAGRQFKDGDEKALLALEDADYQQLLGQLAAPVKRAAPTALFQHTTGTAEGDDNVDLTQPGSAGSLLVKLAQDRADRAEKLRNGRR